MAASDPHGNLIKAMALRVKYRVAATSKRCSVELLAPHPYNRGGAYPSGNHSPVSTQFSLCILFLRSPLRGCSRVRRAVLIQYQAPVSCRVDTCRVDTLIISWLRSLQVRHGVIAHIKKHVVHLETMRVVAGGSPEEGLHERRNSARSCMR